jgi:membrane protease YdiL (CAAX protease family)
LNIFKNKWGSAKGGIMRAVLMSSLVFGIVHLINLAVSPYAVISTLSQVAYSFLMGVFFSAVYLRSGNLWSVIALHALYDASVSVINLFIKETPFEAADIPIADGLTSVLMILPFFLVGLFLLERVDIKLARQR